MYKAIAVLILILAIRMCHQSSSASETPQPASVTHAHLNHPDALATP